MSWTEWSERYPAFLRAPLLERIVSEEARRAPDGRRHDIGLAGLQLTLAGASPEERAPLVEEYAVTLVSRVLGLSTDRLDPHAGLTSLGLDSLMAVEIRNRVEADAGIALPLVRLLQGPSTLELAAGILETWTASSGGSAPESHDNAGDDRRLEAEELLAQLDTFSDDEVASLLKRFSEEDR